MRGFVKICGISGIAGAWLMACFVSQIASAQATTAPAATQPNTPSLYDDMLKVVDQIQTNVRTPKPAATQPGSPATTRAVEPGVFETFEAQLTGKTGPIQFQVEEVHDNRRAPSFIMPPRGVRERLGKEGLLIVATCDNPTPTYMSDQARAVANRQERRGLLNAVETETARAAAEKPRHELWIFTDDPAAQKWTKGSTHTITATVAAATLEPTMRKRYVKATLVLTTNPAATTAPSKPE